MYDEQNVFAKIIRKELPCQCVLETQHTLVFHDRIPKAPVHLLLIPKGFYQDAEAFYQNASPEELIDFSKAIGEVLKTFSHQGFRLISNAGADGGQEVPHFHLHLLAGTVLPPL